MEINWNIVGLAAGLAVYVPMVAWALRKPLKGALAQIRAMPRLGQAVLCVMVVVATVEAQKQQGGGDGGVGGGTNGMMMAGAPLGGGGALPRLEGLQTLGLQGGWRPGMDMMMLWIDPPTSVTPEEVARGYRLVDEMVMPGISFEMPSNAVYIGRLHEHGGRSDFGMHRVDFGEWAFPCGTNDTSSSSLWWFMDGRLQNAVRNPDFTASAGLGETLAVQGESRMWLLEDGGQRRVTWERFFAGGDTNRPVNAQIILNPDGGFVTRSNDLVRVYSRIDPNDWDGDGLDNSIDDDPYVNDGDSHGTGADWINSECDDILFATNGANGELILEWIGNEDAYFWLSFTAQRDGTRVFIDCESESNLGDMVVIANSNQVCNVPLLMGPRYHVTANWPVANITTSDPAANIWSYGTRGFGPSGDFGVQREVELHLTGTAPNIQLTSSPDVGAVFSGFSGGCCNAVFDGALLTWTCCQGCECDGYSHEGLYVTATWEGYTQGLAVGQSCECQEHKKDNPETWLEMSASSVVMLHGELGGLSVRYEPYGEPQGTVTLRCTSGSGKVALWTDEKKTQRASLPITWSADTPNSVGLSIEGVELSDCVDDVEFECVVTGDNPMEITRSLTVAKVKQMNVTSSKAGSSGNEPPFMNGEVYEFSVTNSLMPDKHLVVPFHKVGTLGPGGFSVADFAVDMELELEPEGVSASGLHVEWCVESAIPAMSGSLVDSGGATARFLNPKQGGVYRFRAEVTGASNTYANVVLPLCGAEVGGVFESDFTAIGGVLANLGAKYDVEERQKPTFGLYWFVGSGAGDYKGRVDSAGGRTVWQYNQVSDSSGLGAVATWYGIPTRMAKLGNLLVGYGAETLSVSADLQEQAQGIGTLNDETATASWNAGVGLASGGSLSAVCAALARSMWSGADAKVKNLWPNRSATDNHVTTAGDIDYNFFFRSPGIIWKGEEEFGTTQH